ncbi:hypothetical protein EI983_02735 [Roseovarius faecimaris]|uniref:Uncharacterized protein n=1 Tax=Roseovarius faecimaris TaxID=2494550 RepID=A0A6I6IX87_9RHOB|nr:hypothetical protein [Roseovarius faecimaris]QGX97248.1 hypothetical protein EI983_02735 [Roseovarius faecimaris]
MHPTLFRTIAIIALSGTLASPIWAVSSFPDVPTFWPDADALEPVGPAEAPTKNLIDLPTLPDVTSPENSSR